MLVKYLACVSFALSFLLTSGVVAEELKPAERDFFEKKVRPLLVAKCYKCHSAKEKQKGELVLDTKAGWEMGGETGPAVVPGNPAKSLLVDAIQFGDLEMPPKKKMSDEEIAILVRWVKMGAPDPRKGGGPKSPHGIDVDEGRQYWAFQHPKKTTPPKVKNAAWPRSDIDHFLLAAQEAKGVSPVQDADRLALIRRVTFDLTGLPPTKQDVESFVADGDSTQAALERAVDRLLASPRFGERWGRHWLDVARYGDSRKTNELFSYAWRYRDYVIDSLNNDVPFDQFIKEQIAGDLLPADNDKQRDRQVIATGFLAIGDRSDNQTDEVVDEQMDCTTKAFMSLTVTCARCHDHKFDPIPTEDYYAMAGIFRSTKLKRTQKNNTPQMLTGGDLKKHEAFIKKLESFRKTVTTKMDTVRRNRDRQLNTLRSIERRYRDKPTDKPRPDVERAKKQVAEAEKKFAQVQKEIDTASAELKKLEQNVACAVTESEKVADQRLYLRGERSSQGDKIPRGFVQVVSASDSYLLKNKEQSGRLELAEWIASANNPLTARTFVNRAWHHLFGVGIVPTVDNFGSLGQRPTNQPLLDHLAVEFADDGWSVKRLIRRMVLSRSYQLSTLGNKKNEQVDGDNKLLWRMNRRRLEAEAIRDTILSFSGHLKLEPPKTGQLADYGYRRPDFTVPVRSVYLPMLRQGGYDFFNAFDIADSTIVVGSRPVSTAPAQSLYLLNSPLVMDESKLAAERLLANKDIDDSQRIQQAYWAALSRAPTEQEQDWIVEFIEAFPAVIKSEGKYVKDAHVEAWTRVCQAIIASAEFQILN